MKYTVDRIDNNIAVLISLDGNTKLEKDISNDIKLNEGDVVILEDNKLIKDDITKDIIEKRIKDKFDRLKNK